MSATTSIPIHCPICKQKKTAGVFPAFFEDNLPYPDGHYTLECDDCLQARVTISPQVVIQPDYEATVNTDFIQDEQVYLEEKEEIMPVPAIKVGIVVDAAGTDDQVENIMGLLQASEISCTLAFTHRGVHMLRDKDIDLLIIDYGGVAGLGQMNEARKWADEHPSKLMIIWTLFTSQYYQKLHQTLPALDNVLHNHTGEWEQIVPKIKQWYGIEEGKA